MSKTLGVLIVFISLLLIIFLVEDPTKITERLQGKETSREEITNNIQVVPTSTPVPIYRDVQPVITVNPPEVYITVVAPTPEPIPAITGLQEYAKSEDNYSELKWAYVAIVFTVFVLVFGYWYYRYSILRLEIQYKTEIETTEALTRTKERARVVPVNRPVSYSGHIKLTNSLELSKRDLINFITESLRNDGPGLAISQWRNNGWSQETIEQLLDFLHDAGVVTERQNGRACTYLRDYKPEEILRVVAEKARVYG